MAVGTTLVDRMTPIVDRLRGNLHPKFGTRPYSVHRIVERWTGGKRGVGTPIVAQDYEIVPPVKVSDVSAIEKALHPVGGSEHGLLWITELSLTFTEDWINGKDDDVNQASDNVFFEVRYDDGTMRRFHLAGAPQRDIRTMGWKFKVIRQDGDRTASGGFR